MNLKTEIRNVITEICMEKSNKRIIPLQAVFLEIAERMDRPHQEIKECLREMVRNGELEWGQTINDHYFRNIPKK